MDHEVVHCTPKICDLSWDHFSLHQGKECKNDHGAQKANFQAYIIHCHGSKDFAVKEAKRGSRTTKNHETMIEKCILNIHFQLYFCAEHYYD